MAGVSKSPACLTKLLTPNQQWITVVNLPEQLNKVSKLVGQLFMDLIGCLYMRRQSKYNSVTFDICQVNISECQVKFC